MKMVSTILEIETERFLPPTKFSDFKTSCSKKSYENIVVKVGYSRTRIFRPVLTFQVE